MSPSLRNDVPPHFGQAAPGGSQLLDRPGEPGVGPVLRNRSRKWRTVSAVSNWVWQVVQPSAGIGTPQDRWRLMHQSGRSETMASIRDWPQAGSQLHLVDRLQGPPAQVVVVDGDEPLLGRPEDHRLLAPPAVGIAVHERLLVEQVARRLELLDDPGIGREDLLAGQPVGGLGGEPARRVDRAQDGELIGPAGLVVLGTVAGRGVDQAGAVLDADVAGQHDRADPVDERVAILANARAPCRGTGRPR